MEECGMLSHIISHSIEVAKIALFLSMELNKKGQRIDVSLVEAASLLHDVTKAECLQTREDHAQTGGQFLKRLGYERVGEIVAEHIHLSKGRDPSWISEEEIVNYADKRVRHDQIVSLKERFSDLKDRYAINQAAFGRLEELEKATLKIEMKIFSVLEIDPAHLQHLSLGE